MLRHAWPKLVEAKVVPTVLFLTFLAYSGITMALIICLIWVSGCMGFRKATGRYVPGLVIVGLISLTVRTIVTLITGSTVVYFLQPMLSTTAMGLAFLWSVRKGKPLAGRLAFDFCPFNDETAQNPIVHQFFVRLSVIWGAVSILNGAITFWMLFNVDVATFVVVKSTMGPALTALAIGSSIVWLKRALRAQNTRLVFTRNIAPVAEAEATTNVDAGIPANAPAYDTAPVPVLPVLPLLPAHELAAA